MRMQAELDSSMAFYGASHRLAACCGLGEPLTYTGLRWQHGWCAKETESISPTLVVQELEVQPELCYLVARESQAEYLRSKNLVAKAIGLPFVYADAPPSKRLPNSLLIMPAHSLEYTAHDWKFDEYAQLISKYRRKFETVVACIHPSCVEKEYWLPQFRKLGIPCVAGAGTYDSNGLLRIKSLFQQFQFMTTNTLGSHVVYASACGVKTSIYGEYARFEKADYVAAEFYQRNPQLLEPNIYLWSEEFGKEKYPWLFCEPTQAVERSEWAREQIGWSHRLDPRSIRKLMGWDNATRWRKFAKELGRGVSRKPEQWVKSWVRKAS